jgi:hypothetical protein
LIILPLSLLALLVFLADPPTPKEFRLHRINSNWRDKAPVNFPLRINNKQRAFADTIFVTIDAVPTRHVALRFKVG